MALDKKFISFLKELELNNDRDWFKANKKRFDKDVSAPFDQLTDQVIGKMQKLDPEITVTPKECVFRIYRDTRFSKDKTPYKTHMSAVVGRGGRKDHSFPGLYFQIDANGVSVAGGCWQPDKDRLYRIREKIADDPKAFRKIIDAKTFKDTFTILNEDQNKIIPKEFKDAGEIVPEIYNKSFHYWKTYEGQKYITRDDLADFLVQHYKIADKFNEFLIATI